MGLIDYQRLLIPVELENQDKNGNWGDPSFNTRDYVYIPKTHVGPSGSIIPTDYAIMSNVVSRTLGGKNCSELWRSFTDDAYGRRAMILGNGFSGGIFNCVSMDYERVGIRPCVRLDLNYFLEVYRKHPAIFNIQEDKDILGEFWHTLDFGEYPQSYAGDDVNKTLEKGPSLRVRTVRNVDTCFFQINPRRREANVACNAKKIIGDNNDYFCAGDDETARTIVEFHSGECIKQDSAGMIDAWFKLEPITWNILNWDNLPAEINPKGDGTAEFIDVQTKYVIISGVPFYVGDPSDNYAYMWQNSDIRAMLNGYDRTREISRNNNGNKDFMAPDFSMDQYWNNGKTSFLQMAFGMYTTPIKDASREGNYAVRNQQESEEDVEIINPYGIEIDDVPMTVDEQIKFYFDNYKSFMLHGVSGVGKTRRIEELDPDFTSILLRKGMLPEEVIGKTIFTKESLRTGGRWEAPPWYHELCEKCAKEPDKPHILFIDEITNVNPVEQGLVYHIVLNHSIGPNIGKLPDNVVVASAGNSKDESESAYTMPEPLFRRYDGHIYLKPDIQSFLDWGSEKSDKGEDRLKIHPFISAFVGANAREVFYSKYDSEKPPKYAIDPRGWEQVSDMIYDNDGVIVKELITNKVGEEIASSMIEFANNPILSLEDVLTGNYSNEDIPLKFDGKYALAVGLRYVGEENIDIVRRFIYVNLGEEILSMFDNIWIGDNMQRALLIANSGYIEPNNEPLNDGALINEDLPF